MEIDAIFTLVPGSLYSVQFAGEQDHELGKVFKVWSDASYLRLFFEQHYEDLIAFWEYMSIEDAVAITFEDGIILEEAILSTATAGGNEGFENLSALFKPLNAGTN